MNTLPALHEDATSRAEKKGFDTSKVWYHGSRAAFKTFKHPKPHIGIQELGLGIYLTSRWNTANAWAGHGGHVYRCYIRQGPVFDKAAPLTDEILHKLHDGHSAFMRVQFGDAGVYAYEDFIKHVLKLNAYYKGGPAVGGHVISNRILEMAGYVGAVNKHSQIQGQIVVFDRDDVFIAEREDGGSYRDMDESISKVWYHGTDAALEEGDTILPGGRIGKSNHELSNPDRVYITTDAGIAEVFARDFAKDGNPPRIYEVEPTKPTKSEWWCPDDEHSNEWTCDSALVLREIPTAFEDRVFVDEAVRPPGPVLQWGEPQYDDAATLSAHALVDGKLVGYMDIYPLPTGEYGIAQVTVEPEFQRQGIATALYHFAKKEVPGLVKHSYDATDAGEAWMDSIEEAVRPPGPVLKPWTLTYPEYYIKVNPNLKSHPSTAYQVNVKKLEWMKRERFPHVLKRKDGIDYCAQKETMRYTAHTDTGDIARDEQGVATIMTPEQVAAKGMPDVRVDLAAFDGDVCVGAAQDEWGCVLYMVADEYKGRGIGTTIGHLYRSIYPGKGSGGFTADGSNAFKRIHRKFVEDAWRTGKYRKAITDGTMTEDRVHEIVDSVAPGNWMDEKDQPEWNFDLEGEERDAQEEKMKSYAAEFQRKAGAKLRTEFEQPPVTKRAAHVIEAIIRDEEYYGGSGQTMPAPLKDTDVIRVYHGFNKFQDALDACAHGLSGKERANRIYSYENNNNPRGLFVTADLKVTKEFVSSHDEYLAVIEFHAKVSDLEAPVWPDGSYTVQGGLEKYFDMSSEETHHADREKARLAAREKAKEFGQKDWASYIAQSDRPELARLLYQSREQQALFIGDLNPNMIRAVWVSAKNGRPYHLIGDAYTRMSRADFVAKFKQDIKGRKYKPYGKNPQNKLYKPAEDWKGVEDFIVRLVDDGGGKPEMYRSALDNVFDSGDLKDLESYLWPKQIAQAQKHAKPAVTESAHVPSEPGTLPIPDGHVRLYHQTGVENAASIEQHGLQIGKAKGAGYGEGNAVWADTKPFYGDTGTLATVEFSVPMEDLRAAGGAYAYADETPEQFMAKTRPVAIRRSVRPEEIVAVHLPWHARYRDMMDNDQQADVIAGQFDYLLDDPDYGPALRAITGGYSSSPGSEA